MAYRKKRQKDRQRNRASDSRTCITAFTDSALQNIRRHARKSADLEICGALIGRQTENGTSVVGAIPGEGASQGVAHVTFTQETWVKIHEEKEKRYPGQSIVGWYHSHPGFGVFLSDQDVFIHKNFFSTPGSVAWVYDPISDEEGCFSWNGHEVVRSDRFEVVMDTERTELMQNNIHNNINIINDNHHLQMTNRHNPRIGRLIFLSAIAVIIGLILGIGIGSAILTNSFLVQQFKCLF